MSQRYSESVGGVNRCIMIYITECPGGTVTESDPSARVPFINCTVVTGNLVVGIIPAIGFK